MKTPPPHRAGFIAVMGKPNVGKSTLLNTILGQKVAAVSPRPQTTRKRQLGILTLENAQLVFIDTPGVHQPRHKLGENMNREAIDILQECDSILFIADSSSFPDGADQLLANAIGQLKHLPPLILAMNKIDLIDPDQLPQRVQAYQQLLPDCDTVLISATRGDNLEKIVQLLVATLPESPPFYPDDQVTDLYEREIAADLIREAALLLLRDEVPHGIAVRIDQYTERGERGALIEATIFVERESHKGIVIGKGGGMLKKIGTSARQAIEEMSGRKVYLRLRVKVRKNWRNNEEVLRWFGF